MHTIELTHIGGPSLVLRYASLTIISDPTFDPPGEQGHLTKTAGPALSAGEVGPCDLALISHHHHPDNLDRAGLDFALATPQVLTTRAGAAAHPHMTGMAPGEVVAVRSDPDVSVTAVRALHGPWWADRSTGPVIGFILRADGWPTVYLSGDNASVAVTRRIARAHPDVEVAILHLGAAAVDRLKGHLLTMDAARGAQVATLWPSASIVPVHADQWQHFSQPREEALTQLHAAGLGDRVVALEPGRATTL